jgi:hypothetical protein
MFQTKVVQKIKTHFNVELLSVENSCRFEIMWKSVVQPDMPQTTVWRMRIACWIPKATNKHTDYVILIVFLQQQWLHESA